MTTTDSQPNGVDEARELVIEAFRRAHATGKPGWRRMTPAVLKNRILDLTNREFDEASWSVENFREFVELLGDLVSVDASAGPLVLELNPSALADLETAGPVASQVPGRIRPDLWNAIVDYSTANGWRWDQKDGLALPVQESSSIDPGQRLPTATPNEMADWRREFAASRSERFDQLSGDSRVDRWLSGQGGFQQLPEDIRGPWFDFLKKKVLDRLTQWFEANSLKLPQDVIQSPQAAKRSPDELGAMRAYVAAIVARMELEELRTLEIPLGAVVRAHGHR